MIKMYPRALSLIVFISLFFQLSVFSQNSISINSNTGKEKLESHLLMLISNTSSLPDSTVLAGKVDSKFFNYNSDSIPDKPAQMWFKFQLSNDDDKEQSFYCGTSKFDLLTYYFRDSSGKITALKTGTLFPNKEKKIQMGPFSFGDVLIPPHQTITCYMKAENKVAPAFQFVQLAPTVFTQSQFTFEYGNTWVYNLVFAGIVFIILFYNLMIYIITREKNYLYYLSYNFFILFYVYALSGEAVGRFFFDASKEQMLVLLSGILALLSYTGFGRKVLEIKRHFPKWDKILVVVIYMAVASFVFTLFDLQIVSIPICFTIALIAYTSILVIAFRLTMQRNAPARYFLIASSFYIVMLQLSICQMLGLLPDSIFGLHANNFTQIGICIELSLFSLALGTKINEMRKEKYEAQQLALAASLENEQIVKDQNTMLEQKVTERTGELNKTLTELKSTQNQLILNEKMASMGQMMAGIAHEIKNPLNFVNNFSELSAELVEELKAVTDETERTEMLSDLKNNLSKINQHGKRADSIVASMLQHSRESAGIKSETDINKMCNEFAELSYEGMKSNVSGMRAELEKIFATDLPKIELVQQDLSRVILNLLNNAFYAVNLRTKKEENGYTPIVSIITKKENNEVLICIKDNGTGMSNETMQKVFEPFFTTKPTGEGTGLGLSISYDIIKAHGGDLRVSSMLNVGTEFTIVLPC